MAPSHDEEDGNDELFKRRSVLKAGSALLTSAGVGMTIVRRGSARTLEPESGSDLRGILENVRDGDVIKLDAGGQYTISGNVTVSADEWTLVGNGASISGSGSYVTVKTTGDGYDIGGLYIDGPAEWTVRWNLKGGNWKIHNIAYRKEFGGAAQHLLIPTNEADETTAEITDMWFGEGLAGDKQESAIKAHFSPGSIGNIDVRRCYFYQNGTYATNSSGSGSARMSGSINFSDCYFESCYNGHIRTGSHDGPSCTIENCVIVAKSGDVPGGHTRGIWGFWNTLKATNTHITTPSGYEALTVDEDKGDPFIEFRDGEIDGDIYDSAYNLQNVGSNPKTSPPEACVTSPDDAVQTSEVSVSSAGASDVESSAATLGGALERLQDVSETEVFVAYRPAEADSWSRTASRTLSETGEFSYDVTGLDSGTEYQYKAAADAGDSGIQTGEIRSFVTPPSDATTLEVKGNGTQTNYEFTVTGDLTGTGDLEQWDDVSGATATGWITEEAHVDTFYFSGDVAEFTFHEGEATVHIGGEPVDPETLGAETHELRVQGSGVTTNYEITVDGDIQGANDSLEPWDDVSGATATGYVTATADEDRFNFTGNLTDVTFHEGEATVYVDGEQIDPHVLD